MPDFPPPPPPDPGAGPGAGPGSIPSTTPTATQLERFRAACTLTAYIVSPRGSSSEYLDRTIEDYAQRYGYMAHMVGNLGRTASAAQRAGNDNAPPDMGRNASNDNSPGMGHRMTLRERVSKEKMADSDKINAGLGQRASYENIPGMGRQARLRQRASTEQTARAGNDNTPGIGQNAGYEDIPDMGRRVSLRQKVSTGPLPSNDGEPGMGQSASYDRKSGMGQSGSYENLIRRREALKQRKRQRAMQEQLGEHERDDYHGMEENLKRNLRKMVSFDNETSSSSSKDKNPAKEQRADTPKKTRTADTQQRDASAAPAKDFTLDLPLHRIAVTPEDRALLGPAWAAAHPEHMVPSQPTLPGQQPESYTRTQPTESYTPTQQPESHPRAQPAESYMRSQPIKPRSTTTRRPTFAAPNFPLSNPLTSNPSSSRPNPNPNPNPRLFTFNSTSNSTSTRALPLSTNIRTPRSSVPPDMLVNYDDYTTNDPAELFMCGAGDCDWRGTISGHGPDRRIRCPRCGFPVVLKCRARRYV